MSSFKTDCSACIWNAYHPTWPGKIVDCQLGRYQKFEEKGLINEFGTINRLCTACRNQEWADRHENESVALYKELSNIFSLIIIDKDGKNESKDNVLTRLKTSLKNPQTINPRKITLMYTGDFSMSALNEFLRSFTKDKGIEFSITRLEFTDYEREIIDLAVNGVKTLYYTLQENGVPLNPNLFLSLFNYSEVLLEQSLLIHNPKSRFESEWHGLTCSTLFHKRLNGNVTSILEHKAYTDIENEGMKKYIRIWPAIFSQLSDYEEKNGVIKWGE